MRTFASGSSAAPKRLRIARAPYAHALALAVIGREEHDHLVPLPRGKGVQDDGLGPLDLHHRRGYTADAAMLVHPAEARRQFREFAEGEITNENLARGALLIALEDYPRLDVDGYLDELDALAARVRAPLHARASRRSSASAICTRRCSTSTAIAATRTSYYDPRNAYLNEVIDRKLGIPITLVDHLPARRGEARPHRVGRRTAGALHRESAVRAERGLRRSVPRRHDADRCRRSARCCASSAAARCSSRASTCARGAAGRRCSACSRTCRACGAAPATRGAQQRRRNGWRCSRG